MASFADSIPTFRGDLIVGLRHMGYEVHVAAPQLRLNSRAMKFLDGTGCVAHDVILDRNGTRPLADVALLASYIRLMWNLRPDIVLSYTVKPVVYGSIAAWSVGILARYALVTGLGYAFTADRGGLLSGIVKLMYRFALARVHKVFFQNPDDERLFRETRLLGPDVPSVVVNGSGVDTTLFAVAPLPRITSFLMVGRLIGDKGVREYVAAARAVRVKYPQVQILLAGWIDSNPDAISIEELDCWVSEGVIEYLGRLDDVRPAIARCSVYVLPSYREGTPRTVLEAMSMGRAVITTDAPGCRETVDVGSNGFLVPVKSVDALANVMFRFIEEPGLVARMGEQSRKIAENKYEVHKVNAVMLREMGITAAVGSISNTAA